MNIPVDDSQDIKEVASLFPSLVYKLNPPEIKSRIDDLKDFCAKECASTESEIKNFRISNTTSTQLNEDIEWLNKIILNAAEQVLQWNKAEYDDVYINEMWVNQSGPGYRHPIHTHPNQVLSGIVYVNMPQGCSPTLFYDPRPGFRQLEIGYKDYGPHNSGVVGMATDVADLIFFDPALPHAVEMGFWDPELDDDGNITEWRTTINFNIQIKSQINIPTAHLTLT